MQEHRRAALHIERYLIAELEQVFKWNRYIQTAYYTLSC